MRCVSWLDLYPSTNLTSHEGDSPSRSKISYHLFIPHLQTQGWQASYPVSLSLSLRHFASGPNGRLIFERIFLAEDNRGGNFHLSSAYSSCSAFQRENGNQGKKHHLHPSLLFKHKRIRRKFTKLLFLFKYGYICSFFF